MSRFAALALLLTALVATPALAQSDSDSSGTISGTRIEGATPSSWVRAALTRHSNLMGQRLTGPRFGESNEAEAALRFNGGGSSSSSAGGLLGLANSFASTFGLSGGVESLLGGMAGGSGGTTSGSSGSGSGSGSSPTPDQLAQLEALMALAEGNRQVMNGLGDDVGAESANGFTESAGHQFGGALGRLTKPEQRFQQVEQETPFRIRWADAMLQTFFTSLTVGFQSNDFITILEDALRPLFPFPSDDDTDDGNADDGGDDGNGDDTGGGIEDIDDGDDDDGSDPVI